MNKIKDFFARYGGTIGRILINHIAMSIFGLLVGIAAYGIHPLLYWGACVLGVGMYMFLLYMVMWELGAKENVEVEYGRCPLDKLKGLKISLVTNSVFIIVALVAIIFSFFNLGVADTIAVPMKMFVLSIYLPFFTTFKTFYPLLLLTIIPEVVDCALSYWAGVSGKKCIFPDKKKK